ncbi:MAG: TIGR04282 family arsenosugar biosynthesis glycosyltransferase [Geopsychrobacter sp.]|nr:TIGR04282 family arsenosugar biosynthesis glycosyltransferase [Geopsychrobacter sp.]
MEKVDKSAMCSAASSVLGVFCKAPLAGQVKTRLCPPLQPEQAAALYRVALDETIRRFSEQCFDLVIFYAGAEDYFAREYPDFKRQAQTGADLGARMASALEGLLATGYRQAVLIGSDSPDLPLSHLESAFSALQQHAVVIAPADDGGYVLIGESCHQPHLFTQMPWSQPQLMEESRALLSRLQIDWQQLPVWEDVDDLAAMSRLLARSPHSRTARHIRQNHPFVEAAQP